MSYNFPIVSHSWTILSPDTFVKKMDKSAFIHHGTGIPKDTVKFWGLLSMVPNQKQHIRVLYEESIFEMYFVMDQHKRMRLFWDSSFSKIIQVKYQMLYESFQQGDVLDRSPEMFFRRIEKNVYTIEFVESLYTYPNETKKTHEVLKEGRPILLFSRKYERDPQIRKIAIDLHGYDCHACGFNFEKRYGSLGKNYIEVHHINPLYINGQESIVNPEKDLITVCSNCHRVIHRRRHFVYSITDVKRALQV